MPPDSPGIAPQHLGVGGHGPLAVVAAGRRCPGTSAARAWRSPTPARRASGSVVGGDGALRGERVGSSGWLDRALVVAVVAGEADEPAGPRPPPATTTRAARPARRGGAGDRGGAPCGPPAGRAGCGEPGRSAGPGGRGRRRRPGVARVRPGPGAGTVGAAPVGRRRGSPRAGRLLARVAAGGVRIAIGLAVAAGLPRRRRRSGRVAERCGTGGGPGRRTAGARRAPVWLSRSPATAPLVAPHAPPACAAQRARRPGLS